MNCLIVDDDDVSRAEVEQLIKRFSFLKLVAQCSNAKEAFRLITNNHIDLIFLDVMMPEMTGLDLIKALPQRKPQIILMTLDKNYASEAFDYDVTDFLVKPVSEMRFLKAISKAKTVFENSVPQITSDHLFVKVESTLVKINVRDILYIESLGDYLSIYTDTSRYVVHSTMKSVMDNKLPTDDFIRVHNSFIIRIDKISKIEDNTIVIGNKLIPVSRANKNSLMERLKLL